MNYRYTKIWPTESLTAAASRTIQLRGLDAMSEIIIRIRYTNNGNTPTEHPAKILTALQLVDGSETIVNLTGIQADALQYYHYKRPTSSVLSYIDDNIGTLELHIPFGRWLWDPDLALAPARFVNPQLIVSMDPALGGSAPDAYTFAVIGAMFDGKAVNPVGLISSRQHYTYSLVSSGVENIDLPTDRPLFRFMLQSLARTKAVNSQFANLKVTEDNDKKIWFDETMSNLIKDLQGDLPPYIETLQANVTTSGLDVFCTPCYEDYIDFADTGTANDQGSASYKGGGKHTIDVAAGTQIGGLAHGWCPHGSFSFETGDPWDYTDWYIPRTGGIVKAQVTGGSSVLAASTAQVVLQSLKKY